MPRRARGSEVVQAQLAARRRVRALAHDEHARRRPENEKVATAPGEQKSRGAVGMDGRGPEANDRTEMAERMRQRPESLRRRRTYLRM